MSEELDKRVVELQFDNAQFEKNVKQSMKTIDKLDESLQFKNVSPSLEKVKASFTALQVVAITAVANISNRIVNLGIQLVKSLSIDNITTGWSKFEQKTMSVATMASQSIKIAGKELTNYSDKIAGINDQLDKLNWYTDETSYNFTDMASNIGKFTAAGRGLDESVNAMMGIANWAALSGQNATVASQAMYQLAQALGKGYVQLIDWKSIQVANMDTREFRQTALDTAVAIGELTKEGQNYITKTGKRFNIDQFTEGLAGKWFTNDVLLKSLEKYSSAVDKIYEISEKTGLTATEVMARYSDELDVFGLKAFKAAQEARTFTDAIRAVKDAVSTGWLNTAEKIFGGYDESKILWSELANQLYDVFAEGGNFRNEILGMWKDLAGRADIFGEHGSLNQGAFWNIYDSIIAVKNLIKETWNSIFSITEFSSYSDKVSDLAEKIKSITARFREFTKRIKDTIENSFELRAIFAGLFSVFKVVIQLIYGIAYALDPIVQVIKNVFSLLFNRIAAFGMNLTKIDGVINAIQVASKGIANILSDIIDFINPVGILEGFFKLLSKIYRLIADTHILEKAAVAVKAFIAAFKTKSPLDLFTSVASGVTILKKSLGSKGASDENAISDPLNALTSGLASLIKGIMAVLKPLVVIIGQMLNLIGVILESVGEIIESVIAVFNGTEKSKLVKTLVIVGVILALIIAIISLMFKAFYAITGFLNPIKYLITSIADMFFEIGRSFKIKAIAALISSIGQMLLMLAISLAIIANIPEKNFGRAAITLVVLTTVMGAIILFMMSITRFGNFNAVPIAKMLLAVSISILVVTKAIEKIANIGDPAKIWSAVGAIIAVLFAFVIFIKAMNRLANLDAPKGIKVIMALVSLVGTLFILNKAIRSFEDMSLQAASKALGSLLSVIFILSYIMKTLARTGKDAGRMAAIGASLVILAISIGVIALALKLFNDVPVDSALKGIGILAASLLILASVAKYMATTKKSTTRMLVVAASLAILAVSLGIMAMALKSFNNISLESVMKGMLTLFASLLMLGVMVQYFATTQKSTERMMLIGVSLIILAGAIAAFALALQLLNNVSWTSIGKGGAIVAGGFFLLGLAAKILEPLIVTIFLLSSSMLMLGLGMITAAIALGLFATNLTVFVGTLIENASLIGQALVTIGPVLVTALIEAFKMLFDRMGELIPSIVNMVKELINGLVIILNECSGPLIIAIVGLIDKLLKAIADNSESIFESVFEMINSFLDILVSKGGEIAGKLIDFLIVVLEEITKRRPEIAKSIMDLVIALSNAFFDNVGPLIEVLTTRLYDFLIEFTKLFSKKTLEFTNIFTQIVLVLIANVIKLVIISLGTLSKLFLDLLGGIILILVKTFVGMNEVLKQAMYTILYNIFYSLYTLLSELPDVLSNLITGAIQALLGSVVKIVGNLIKAIFPEVGQDIINAGENMINKSKSSLNDAILKGTNVEGAIKTARKNISKTIGMVSGFITEDIDSGIKDITNAMNDSFDSMGVSTEKKAEETGQYTGDGLVKGLNNKSGDAFNAGEDLGDETISGYKQATKTKSPSKVMEQMGRYFVAGLVNGIDGDTQSAKDSVLGLMNEALSSIESVLNSDMDTEFSIRPVMDLSEVSAGAANISSLMSSISGGNVSVSGKLASSVAKKTATKSGSSENQNSSTINNAGDTYNATFNVTSDNAEEVAKQVNISLQKMSVQSKLAKGGVR